VMSIVVEQLLIIFALLLCYAFNMHGWLHERDPIPCALFSWLVQSVINLLQGQINLTVIDATCLSGGEPIICPSRAMYAQALSVGHSLRLECRAKVGCMDGTYTLVVGGSLQACVCQAVAALHCTCICILWPLLLLLELVEVECFVRVNRFVPHSPVSRCGPLKPFGATYRGLLVGGLCR
jgi:hypothetical protein